MTTGDNTLDQQSLAKFKGSMNHGIIWLLIAAAGMIAFFWIGLKSLLDAWELPEYSHGYLIPFIAVYLFLIRLQHDKAAPAQRPSRSLLGLFTVAGGMLLGFFGNLVNIPDISTYGFIVCVAGLTLVTMGTRRGLLYWAPVFYLIFMLPLPNFIYWPLSIKLQSISSILGVELIKLVGIPVFLEGNVIDLGVYKLQVAEACSGLRYLFPLASFGFLFAVFYKGPIWHRAILFLSALPITVLMNSFRIGVIGVLVDRFGTEQAEGFLHFFEGWVIFIACIALLYLLAYLLQWTVKDRQTIHSMLEVDFGALAKQLGKISAIPSTIPLMIAALALLTAGIAWHLAPSRTITPPERSPLVLFPKQLDDWRGGSSQTLDIAVERILSADDYLLVDFTRPGSGEVVNLFVAYYRSQTEGSGIHSPEVCIPAGGWEVSAWKKADTQIETGTGETLAVNRAIIQKGLNRQLVYYWFEQRGRHLTSDYAAKAYTVWDELSRGRSDGALVRVVTPVGPTESLEAADQRLAAFLRLALRDLPAYVPN